MKIDLLTLTELYTRVAKGYNNLDYREIEAVAASNIRYTSQNVLEELAGKEKVLAYLKNKFQIVKKANDPVYAELATMKSQKDWTIQIGNLFEGDPCILLSQGSKDVKGAIVLILTNENGQVRAINICTVVPHWSTAIGTGVYPE